MTCKLIEADVALAGLERRDLDRHGDDKTNTRIIIEIMKLI
jgi:hypothetical protein